MQQRFVFARLFATALALGLALAAPAGAQDRVTERGRTVSGHEDGTTTIDRTFERESLRTGRSATGGSSTVVTPGEAASLREAQTWETQGGRETLGGRSVGFEASGSRTRDGEGGASVEGTRQWSTTGRDGEEKTRSVDYERDKAVTHNEDGSLTVDRSWEKGHQESGRTASGSSSTTYTKTDDGVSWEREGERTRFGGRTLESQGAGSRTRSEDGSLQVQRESTLTDTRTGRSRTRDAGRTRTPNGDGTGTFSRWGTTTRRDADGNVTGWRSGSGSGDWQRNDRGGRDFHYEGSATNSRGRRVHHEQRSRTQRSGPRRR